MGRPYVVTHRFVPVTVAPWGSSPRGSARTLGRVRDLALNPTTGDIAFTRGADGVRRAALTAPGAASIRQKLYLRLGLVAGEYPFDAEVGIPLFTRVLGKASGAAVAEGVYRRAVATCPGVRAIESWRFALGADRQASLTFRVSTLDGDTFTVTDFAAGAA